MRRARFINPRRPFAAPDPANRRDRRWKPWRLTSMTPTTLRPILIRTCLAVTACFTLAPRSITAEIPQPVEHLVGRSLDASGTYAGPIDIVIGRWSTAEEIESLRKP